MARSVRPVTVAATISGDPDEVFAFIADTRNDPEWNANVTEVSQVAGEGVEVGAQFAFTQTIVAGKRTLVSHVTTTVVELGERTVVWDIEDKYQTRRITMTVEPHTDGSKVTQVTEATFKRDPGWTARIYPMLAKRTFRAQFDALKDVFRD